MQGIAITGLSSGTGTWQYSTDGGSNWTAIGTVSGSSALLLRSTDSVRFVPDGRNATSASLTYCAWDQSGGTAGSRADASTRGGSSAYSVAGDTASITVGAVNDAPVLNPRHPTLAPMAADQTTNPGQSVAAIVGASITDPDAGASPGIAVTAVNNGGGTWQYSLDNGSTWTAIGPASDASALLLRPTDRVRLVPDGTHGGTGSITYRAWDQTSGSAGGHADTQAGPQATSSFSSASDTASLVVTAVDVPAPNHAPVITSNGGGSAATVSVAENTSLVTVVEAADADVPAQTLGFAITGGADAARFTIDARTGALRFAEAPDFEAPSDVGADNVYELVVQSSDGTLTVTQTIAVTVRDLNDNAPRITSNGGGASAAATVAEGRTGITKVTATDADTPAGTLSFAIVGGADAALFAIDAATGDLRFVHAPTFDPAGKNRYNVIVGVSDGMLSHTQALTISITGNLTAQPAQHPSAPADAPAEPVPQAVLPGASTSATASATAAAPVHLAVVIATPPTHPAGDGGAGGEPTNAARPAATRIAPVLVMRSIEPAHSAALHEQGAYIAPRLVTVQTYFEAMQASASSEHHVEGLQAATPDDAELGPEVSELRVALVGSLAATAGFLLWASRGAALLTSLLVSAPAWRSYDLLPVLRRDEKTRIATARAGSPATVLDGTSDDWSTDDGDEEPDGPDPAEPVDRRDSPAAPAAAQRPMPPTATP